MDGTAIEKIQEGNSVQKLNEQLKIRAGIPVAVVPGNHSVESLERFDLNRARFRGHLKTTSLPDFALYVADNYSDGEGGVFMDPQDMSATAIFNLYLETNPGHGDHFALLFCKKTAAFKELLSKNGHRFNQKDMAEWLEDWRSWLVALDVNNVEIPIGKAIAAIRRMTIEATSKADSEVKNFGTSRSAMENIEAKSQEQLPAYLRFTCIPYNDLGDRQFILRVGILTGSAKPEFTLRIIRLEDHEELMAKEFKSLLVDQLPANTEVFIGNFEIGR